MVYIIVIITVIINFNTVTSIMFKEIYVEGM